MSHAPRPTTVFPPSTATTSSLRQPSIGSQNSQQSAALQARITSKKAELGNLRQLRDLSGALAGQMSQLEEKLATLRDGTEAVACVLANWDHVLKAISLASLKAVKVTETNGHSGDTKHEAPELPATLIRIPVQEKENVDKAIEAQNGDGNSQTITPVSEKQFMDRVLPDAPGPSAES